MIPEFSMFYKKNSRHFLKVHVKLRGNFDQGNPLHLRRCVEQYTKVFEVEGVLFNKSGQCVSQIKMNTCFKKQDAS